MHKPKTQLHAHLSCLWSLRTEQQRAKFRSLGVVGSAADKTLTKKSKLALLLFKSTPFSSMKVGSKNRRERNTMTRGSASHSAVSSKYLFRHWLTIGSYLEETEERFYLDWIVFVPWKTLWFFVSGPRVVRRIKDELAQCLERDGYRSVAEAVGAEHRRWRRCRFACLDRYFRSLQPPLFRTFCRFLKPHLLSELVKPLVGGKKRFAIGEWGREKRENILHNFVCMFLCRMKWNFEEKLRTQAICPLRLFYQAICPLLPSIRYVRTAARRASPTIVCVDISCLWGHSTEPFPAQRPV